jgi:hypothetical protein
VGLRDPHVSPEGTLSEIVIVPAKLFTAVSVMVEIEEDPGATAAGDEALTRKSWKLKTAVAVWIRPPLVPVMARM